MREVQAYSRDPSQALCTNAIGPIPASCNAPGRRCRHRGRVVLNCAIVDDNGLFRQAARILLEREGITVAATAATAAEALERVRALDPDVVLVDVALGKDDGVDLARRLATESRPVILISANSETDYLDVIPRSHAIGFLDKTELSAKRIRELLGIVPGSCGAGG